MSELREAMLTYRCNAKPPRKPKPKPTIRVWLRAIRWWSNTRLCDICGERRTANKSTPHWWAEWGPVCDSCESSKAWRKRDESRHESI